MAHLTNVDIKGLDHYLISTDGKIFNSKNKMGEVKSWPNKITKYNQVILQNAKAGIKPILFYVHRLVASAYIPNPKNLPEVNHRDRNKNNNDVSNLEWITTRDNVIHYYSSKGAHSHKGKTFANTKTNFIINNTGLLNSGIKLFKKNKDITQLMEYWNISKPSVKKILDNNNIDWRVRKLKNK
jgi:hypothetical protein